MGIKTSSTQEGTLQESKVDLDIFPRWYQDTETQLKVPVTFTGVSEESV